MAHGATLFDDGKILNLWSHIHKGTAKTALTTTTYIRYSVHSETKTTGDEEQGKGERGSPSGAWGNVDMRWQAAKQDSSWHRQNNRNERRWGENYYLASSVPEFFFLCSGTWSVQHLNYLQQVIYLVASRVTVSRAVQGPSDGSHWGAVANHQVPAASPVRLLSRASIPWTAKLSRA